MRPIIRVAHVHYIHVTAANGIRTFSIISLDKTLGLSTPAVVIELVEDVEHTIRCGDLLLIMRAVRLARWGRVLDGEFSARPLCFVRLVQELLGRGTVVHEHRGGCGSHVLSRK